MNKTKKIISLILSVIMIISLCAGLDFSAYAVSSSGWCGNSVRYTFDSTTGELVISGTGAMSDYFNNPYSPFYDTDNIKKVTINNGVTTIGNYAFSSCRGLTSITIPNSIVTIGNNAFSNSTKLTSITIPDSVTDIGNFAFYNCTGLTNVTIPDSVTSIGDYAFRDCTGLTNVTIGNGVISIGYEAFMYCTGLTSVTIGNGVTSIGSNAFYGCAGIKELTMPASAKICNSSNTFYNCTNIEKVTLTKGAGTMQDYSYYFSDSDTYYRYTPWYTSRANIKEIVIEDGVKNIGNSAFEECTGLTSVTIPNSVTSIGDYAFRDCTGLTSVTIGKSVKSIGDDAFYGCTGLTSVAIPDSVTSIGSFAFENCTGLTSITMGKSVKNIGDYAFCNCTRLKNITIPKSVTIIGDYAFENIDDYPYVFYSSSKSDWDKIEIGIYNRPLSNAYIHYNNTKHEIVYNKTKATLSKNGVIQNSCKGCGQVSGKKTIIYYPKTITLSATKYTFDGKVKKPSVKVVGSDGKAISSSNYTVTYPSGRMAPGKYNVKITFKSNYSGSVTKQFSIVQKATSLSSVTSPAKGKMKMSWKKVAGASGYNVQMSTSKSFSASKTADVNFGPSKTSATGKATSKKKYYVRIRTYKTVKGKNYYSNWSSVKTVTIR